jgi:hypothetical protein
MMEYVCLYNILFYRHDPKYIFNVHLKSTSIQNHMYMKNSLLILYLEDMKIIIVRQLA